MRAGWLCWVLAMGLVGDATARAIPSPSHALGGSWVMMVSARVESGEVDNHVARLVLDDVQTLRGKPDAPGKLAIRTLPWTLDRVAPGDRLIVAYTQFRRDPTLQDRRILDPDGPMMLVEDGLLPAMFRDNADTRARLFDQAGKLREPTLAEVVEGLSHDDPHWQSYYAHELSMRTDLRANWDRKTRTAVEALMRDVDADPAARASLFRAAAAQQRERAAAPWWAGPALDVLRTHVTLVEARDGDLSADFIRSVFDVLESANVPVDAAVAARWITCNSAALSERALLAIRRHEPEQESALIAQALQRSLLPAESRAFLLDHQRRLQAMRDALVLRNDTPSP
ncbi:MAG: hypothetical protein KDJ14_13170 [Xanthomonadales bacterium]|nr:hypothetical protein [Xanthomonadales bacterium]